MEQDSTTSLIPFANYQEGIKKYMPERRSKMVSRYTLEDDSEIPSADCSNGSFWNRLVQQQSSRWMEEYHEAPSLLMSSCVVQRPGEAEGGPLPWQVISTVQQLPSPRELCRRRKRGAKQQRLEKGSVSSVCSHLEELKRRQSSIDELKKATWGGCLPQPFHEEVPNAPCLHHRASLDPFSMPRSAAQLCENEASTDTAVQCSAQLLYPEWNSSMREQQRSPPGSPIVSYTTATLGRYPMMVACMPEEDFGFQLQSEE